MVTANERCCACSCHIIVPGKANPALAVRESLDGTMVSRPQVDKVQDRARRVLQDALRNPGTRPSQLLAPPVNHGDRYRQNPWNRRGVTATLARDVFNFATDRYLERYCKIEAGLRWTKSSGVEPFLPLVRQIAYSIGRDSALKKSRTAVGATYGYLSAIGALSYRPGHGGRYAGLAYGFAALDIHMPGCAANDVPRGAPQNVAPKSTPNLDYPKREVRYKKSRDVSQLDLNPIHAERPALTLAGQSLLTELTRQIGKVKPQKAEYADLTDRAIEHAEFITELNRCGASIGQGEVTGRANAFRAAAQSLLRENDLTKMAGSDFQAFLAGVLKRYCSDHGVRKSYSNGFVATGDVE